MRLGFLLALALVPVSGAAPAGAVTMQAHRASYDLKLADGSNDLIDADGRIAIEIGYDACKAYVFDYRFVARFQENQDLVVTDQQTHSTESLDGKSFVFETKSFVDGTPNSTVSGHATTEGDTTKVTVEQPTGETTELPSVLFPVQHTKALIEAAEAGKPILESRLYDGDPDPAKRLTSTAIIGPAAPKRSETGQGNGATRDAGAGQRGTEAGNGTGGGAGPEKQTAQTPAEARTKSGPAKKLAGLRSWRVSESFYDTDSDPDGLPRFETSYTLYENGVSDDLKLGFDGYVLEGGLSTLTYLDVPDCP